MMYTTSARRRFFSSIFYFYYLFLLFLRQIDVLDVLFVTTKRLKRQYLQMHGSYTRLALNTPVVPKTRDWFTATSRRAGSCGSTRTRPARRETGTFGRGTSSTASPNPLFLDFKHSFLLLAASFYNLVVGNLFDGERSCVRRTDQTRKLYYQFV